MFLSFQTILWYNCFTHFQAFQSSKSQMPGAARSWGGKLKRLLSSLFLNKVKVRRFYLDFENTLRKIKLLIQTFRGWVTRIPNFMHWCFASTRVKNKLKVSFFPLLISRYLFRPWRNLKQRTRLTLKRNVVFGWTLCNLKEKLSRWLLNNKHSWKLFP